MSQFFKDVLEGRVRDVKKWVEGGQRVGLFDQYGNTALHLAAEKGFRGVCKVLLDAGADVNQRNNSVGWTAVHYAAYEGHSDVLRMLLAHGATPDIEDKAGDTASSYAKEWDNMECLQILDESTGNHQTRTRTSSKADSLCDSEENRSASDDSDDDEDESSMMNWVCPNPVSNLGQLSKTVENLAVLTQTKEDKSEMEISFHLSPPNNQFVTGDKAVENIKDILKSAEVFRQSKSVMEDTEDNTESDDTLELINQSNVVIGIRDKSPNKLIERPESIVDRMLNISKSPVPSSSQDFTSISQNYRSQQLVSHSNLSHQSAMRDESKDDITIGSEDSITEQALPDIDKILDISITNYKETERRKKDKLHIHQGIIGNNSSHNENQDNCKKLNVQEHNLKNEDMKRNSCEVYCVPKKNEKDTSKITERSVVRALSQAKEIISRERQINGHQVPARENLMSTLSSATIPDDMTMSCVSVLDLISGEETEKDLLLRKLKELVNVEAGQAKDQLEIKRKNIVDLETNHRNKMDSLRKENETLEREMIERHKTERENLLLKHRQEEERVQSEVEKLENELENILAPSQLLANLTSTQDLSCSSASLVTAEINDLEQELECCNCHTVCVPPVKIYQCNEGDLICGNCRAQENKLVNCPSCEIPLRGQTSRNKVLENIARKYFKGR